MLDQQKIDEAALKAEKDLIYWQKLQAFLQEQEAGLTDENRRIREECEGSLYTFVKYAWKYMDPSEFIDGWHLEAVCEHLQAQKEGEIRHLLVNQPPRTSKSLICSVALTPWIWAQPDAGPLSGPDMTFLYASYAQTLSFRDSLKARRLIMSPWYQKMWGTRFQLSDDMNTKGRFTNNVGGHRIATSVGGQLTGDGASWICLPYEQKITTDAGDIEIGRIVEEKLDVRVLSYNHEKKTTEWDSIESYQTNPFRQLIEIEIDDGKIFQCTEDHEVFVVGKGYIPAKNVETEDEVIVNGMSI